MGSLTDEYRHIPVMLDEVDNLLGLRPGEVFCDCTLGGGGHSAMLGRRLGKDGLLIGIDRDAEAILAAGRHLAAALPDTPQRILEGNFADLDDLLLSLALPGVDAFLFDLGISSHQIDSSDRGFSYAREAPLDMRANPGTQTITAAEVINTKNEADLTWIFASYGEERWAAKIAQAITRRRIVRPFTDTADLAETIRDAIPAAARRTGGHPAKRCFMALRIYVNGELDALTDGLEAAFRWLNPGGRIAVLSYHSLEDRIVKQAIGEATTGCTCPPEVLVCICNRKPVFKTLTKKPLTPSVGEVERNPRSASAKLRGLMKLKS